MLTFPSGLLVREIGCRLLRVDCTDLSNKLAVIVHEQEKTGLPSNRVIHDPDTNYKILKAVYPLVELLLAGYFTTRLSVLCLYLRLFSGRVFRILTWGLIAIVTAQYIAFAIASLLQCQPASHFWNQAYRPLDGKCFDIDQFYRSVSPNVAFTLVARYTYNDSNIRSVTCPNIVIDVILIVLPVPSIVNLKISRLRKVGLMLIFCWSGL